MSSKQLMLIDGQPTHQVVVNQQQIGYQKTPAAGIITIPQQQTFFYMDNTNNIPTELAQVESVEVQPIVLNHRLGNQISLLPRPLKQTSVPTQQFHFMQQVQQQTCTTRIAKPQVGSTNNQSSQTVQEQHQIQNFISPSLQHKYQEHFVSTSSNSGFRQQITQQFQKTTSNTGIQIGVELDSTQNVIVPDSVKAVSLGEPKVMDISGYKEMLIKQQQQRLNLLPDISLKKTRTPNISRARPKMTNLAATNRNTHSKLNTRTDNVNAEKIEPSQIGPQVVSSSSLAITSPSLIVNSPSQYKRQTQTHMDSSNRTVAHYQSNDSNQQQQIVQNSSSQHMTTTEQIHWNQHRSQQMQNQNGHNFVIKPYKIDDNKAKISLPSCISPSQLQQVIDRAPIHEDYPDSIRMLILHTNGEQRLITFSLPNQACTIQEILDQVEVPLTPETLIEVTETNTNGINYVVTIGFLLSGVQNNERCELVNNGVLCSELLTTPEQVSEVREPTPEPVKEVEQPKFIEGKMAVCSYCGYLSDDFNKCMRCKTKLPENVKAITANMKKEENKQVATKKNDSVNSAFTNGTKDAIVVKKKPATRSKSHEETVILTLSSDDEDDTDKSTGPIHESLLQKLGSSVTLSPIIKKEPSISDIQKSSLNINDNQNNTTLDNSKGVLLQCRTVRIGSYRTFAKENVIIEGYGVTMKVLNLTSKSLVTLRIERSDIVKVLICFQKQLPLLFYYLKPYMGKTIRDLLGMKDNVNYFDPLSDAEPHRRLTILPENIPDDVKAAILDIYKPSTNGNSILEELTLKEANDILIKTCPKELTLANLQPTTGSLFDVKPLFTYPPEGRGRISINTEDFMCLGSDQFLNDVIIDFYLKYLVNALIPEEQDKIHVFSTFFYKRLTTKPIKASRKNQPAELDPFLSPAEKRHARVKTWTKNIDLFKKDFVVVPINENCHWFLAIICFPGLDGCQTFEGNPIKIEITPKKKNNAKTTIGNVTITPIKKEELPCEDLESDKDEAEGDESELESDDSNDDTQTVTSHVNRPPIKQPCILIFDSLAGTGRSRVVATLRDYLTCEYKAKYNKEKVFTKDVIKGACPKVPQQTNFTDCGLYLLQYVEHFLMEPIQDYYIPINSLKNWFDELIVTKKREDITNLIKKLMEQYDKDLSLLPGILLPTKNGVVVDQFAEDEDNDDEIFDNEEFESPPVGSETEVDTSMSIQDEEFLKSGSFSSQDASDSASENKLNEAIINSELLKTESNELTLSKPHSNRETLSYLKAKRIIRNKNLEGPDSKKVKLSQ